MIKNWNHIMVMHNPQHPGAIIHELLISGAELTVTELQRDYDIYLTKKKSSKIIVDPIKAA
ncbi:MAG: hypothetical protein ACKOAD_08400 [Gammaproteobacteria bacterium]